MIIGIVTTWFERGAAYVSKQYKDLLKEKHEVHIYVRGGEEYAIDNPHWAVDNLYWGRRIKFFAGSIIVLADFKKWIIQNKIEVVFFNEQHHWTPVVLCNQLGIKVGAYIDYYKKETLPLFNAYDFVICNTQRHFSVFKGHAQSYYVPWGTLPDIFFPKAKPQEFKDKFTFFHSAGMNPKRKGTDLVLKAACEINNDGFKILIHTQVDLLDFFPEMRSEIKNLKSKNKLQIINKTISAPGIYHYGDVYIYPTRLEGIGLTIAEASSSGLPVITTNQAPMNEFVKDKVNGRLVDVEKEFFREDNYYWPQSIVSISSLKECMKWYINHQHEMVALKSTSRLYAEQHLDWRKNVKVLDDIFLNTKIIKSQEKENAIKACLDFEKDRKLISYINTFLPYVNLKRKIKRLLK